MKNKAMKHNISNIESYKPINDYLYRQDNKQAAALKYGRLGKRIENVGCALVAVFNVMKRLGKPRAMTEIISSAEKLRMPWLFGVFGTKPRSLGRYFSANGVEYARISDLAEFKERLNGCNCAIICTWNDKRLHGIHFYAVFNDGGTLTSLNRFCNNDNAIPFSPDVLKENRFITGYLF